MPEGDTIHRTARSLQAALADHQISRFSAPRLAPPLPAPGETITGVRAEGKHLLTSFSGGLVLHTHMRMTGAWHLYRPGERWQRSRRSARIVLETSATVAVCFDAPVVEMLDGPAVERHPVLRALGPDLCLPDPDLDEIARRAMRLHTGREPLVDLLLDQRVAAGIGNVYKCEVAFLHGVHPATTLGAVPDDVRRGLYATAARLLRGNLDGSRRTTVPGRPGQLHVYGRGGEPCRACGTAITAERLGRPPRITYWCPACQPSPASVGPSAAARPRRGT